MKKETKPFTQMQLMVRLLAGGYLLYSAWKLRNATAESPLFIIAIVAFLVIGALLVSQAGWKLYKGQYEGGPGMAAPEPEEPEETTEE